MSRIASPVVLLMLAAGAAAASASADGPSRRVAATAVVRTSRDTVRPTITVTPSRPVQGSLIRISVVAPAPGIAVLARDTAPDSVARVGAATDTAKRDSMVAPAPADSGKRASVAAPAPADSAKRDSVAPVPADSAPAAAPPPVDTSAAPSRPDSVLAVHGRLAGEPLHFERDSTGTYAALGAIPIDAVDSIPLRLVVARASGVADTVVMQVGVAAAAFRMERLTVAPQYGREPDSAIAARLARDAAIAREVSQRSHETPRLWRDPFTRPRPSEVTSGFGHGRQFNGVVQSRHMGVDFRGAIGAAVRAANRGVVAVVDTFYLGGRVVYVDHGAGLVTAYLHLSKADVAVGDTVARGQIIGRVGDTGRVTGPHLHWIARYGQVTVNPLSLLDLSRE